MKRLLAPLLLLSLILGVLAGCSSVTETIASGLRIEVIQVQRESNGAVLVTWRVHNPNVVAYLFSKSAHKLSLNGTLVGTFEDVTPLGVPQFNQAERTATLNPSAAASPVIDQAIARGSADYQLDAAVWVLIIDDQVEKISLKASGSVPVAAK